ncbi:MAG: hypothetical protein J6C16_00255 [Clostridia bacterium]|nr:hypothetical protein [Clostridia bacterium]
MKNVLIEEIIKISEEVTILSEELQALLLQLNEEVSIFEFIEGDTK